LCGKLINQRIVCATGDVILVLHANNGRHLLRIGHLFCGHVAKADVADKATLFKLKQRGQRRFQRTFYRAVGASILRRFTISSTSSPRLRRLSSTACVSSSGDIAGSQLPFHRGER
jgi:hypothetical protein